MAINDNINNVLGIETSCDETAVAIYNKTKGLLSHKIYSQVDLHSSYGGVVPELASRDHIRKLLPLIDSSLKSANLTKHDLDGMAYTKGPGLVGALLVGTVLAKTMAHCLKIPCLGIHHMEGHMLAPLLEDKQPKLPFIALLVSGGHTLLVRVDKLGEYKILGESIDDAAGEAFDKTAKILGLGYPGGAALAKLAESGDNSAYNFPRPMVNKPNLDFSFSGLKTAALNTWNKSNQSEQDKANIAACFQDAVVDTLFLKCKRGLLENDVNQLVIAGGVSANKKLRSELNNLMQDLNGELYLPRPEYCTDNGAMIAYVGFLRLANNQFDNDISNEQIDLNSPNDPSNNYKFSIVRPRWPLTELEKI